MSLHRLTSLLPRPHHAVDLVKRVIELVPGLPGGREERAEPFEPSAPTPPPPPVKPKAADKPKAAKPKAKAAKAKAKARKANPAKAPKRQAGQPKTAPPGVAASGFPEPPGKDPGDISADREPHHALNNPVTDPDLTEYPDPFEQRRDPRGSIAAEGGVDGGGEALQEEPRSEPGATSTSEPPPEQDPEAQARREKLDRERLDR